MPEQAEKDLRSFVTFSLAMKPKVSFHRKPDSRGPELNLSFAVKEGKEGKVDTRFHTLEPLLEKYRSLKPYLNAILKSGETIADCAPTINFQPNTHYRTIRLTEGEFNIAKEAAIHLGNIESARASNDTASASAQFERFQAYLQSKRDSMVSAFKGLQIANPVASFGAGRVADDGDCTGAVIFVIAEAIICVPLAESEEQSVV